MLEDSFSAVFALVSGLAMFVLAVLAAWLCARFLGRRFAGMGAAGRQIQVIERVALGPDRALFLVRTAGRVFLIGSAPHQLSLIEELDAAAFPETPGQPPPGGFDALFEAMKRQGEKFKEKKEKPDG